MFTGLTNAFLYTALRLQASFNVGTVQKAVSGTGFFVQAADKSICLVTNRHVLDLGYGDDTGKYRDAKLIELNVDGFLVRDKNINQKPTPKNVGRLKVDASTIRFAADYFEDVACIRPIILEGPSNEPVRVDYFIDSTLLADDSWIDEFLSVCDFVAFPGYPPWHDKLEGRPILRTGTIASDPRANYSDSPTPKGRRIAYEAFSFGGSSGSPVFALQIGFHAGAGVKVSGFRETRLIGVNAGHMKGDHGTHSGISYFIRSSVILELLR